MAEELVESLREEGRRAETGEIGLDQDRARRKLQKFQLADPHEYVLQFVEAGYLLGATGIEIEVDADEVEVRFDGSALRREELESVYASAFRGRRDARTRALRHLAIGLMSAQEVDPSYIRIETAPADGEGTAVVVDSEGELSVEDHPGPEGATTRIYLRETLRASHIPRFFHKFQGELTEQKLVREACRYASIPVRLNGRSVVGDRDPRGDVVTDLEFETAEESGVIGIQKPDQVEVAAWRRTGRAWLTQNGVFKSVCRFAQRLKPARPMVIVETDRLRKNLSQSAFVEDEAWRRLTDEILPEIAIDALNVFMAELTDDEVRSYRDWLELLFWSVSTEIVEGEPGMGTVRLGEKLAEVPIFPLATPVSTSERTLEIDGVLHVPPAAEMRHSAPTQFATRRFPYSPREGREQVLLAESERTRSALESLGEALFGGLEDLTEQLRADQKRRVNRQKWLERVRYELPRSSLPGTRTRVEEGEFECSVVFRARGGNTVMHIVKEGRLLEGLSLDGTRLPNGVLVISGPVEPNEQWSGAARDEPFRRAVYRLLVAVPAELAEVASLYTSIRNVVPKWVPELLRLFVQGWFAGRFLKILGLDPGERLPEFRQWFREKMELDHSDSIWSLNVRPPFDRVPDREEVVRKLGALAEIPVFRMLPGEPVSVAEMYDHFEENGRIAYIDDEDESGWWVPDVRNEGLQGLIRKYEMGNWGEPIAVVNSAERELLQNLVGDGAEEIGEEFELRARVEKIVRDQPPLEFQEETYLTHRDLDGPNWSAQIGFRLTAGDAEDPGPHAMGGGGQLRMELTYRRRALNTEVFDFPVGQMRAIVESTHWSMNSATTSVRSDDFYRDVVGSVQTAARSLGVSFCEEVAEEFESAPDWKMILVWRFIAETPIEEPFGDLRELAVFPTVDDGLVSCDELLDHFVGRSNLPFVLSGDEVDPEARPDDGTPVLRIPSGRASWEAMKSLFGPDSLVRVDEARAESRAVGQARATFLDQPTMEPRLQAVDGLVRRDDERLGEGRIESDGMEGEMALYAPGSGGMNGAVDYEVLYEGRPLTSDRLLVPIGSGSAVVETEFVEPNRTFDVIEEGKSRLEGRLVRGLARGIEAVIRRVDGSAADERREERRAVLVWLRKLDRLETLESETWREVAESLRNCRAFPLAGEGAVDVESFRGRVSEAGGRLVLLEPGAPRHSEFTEGEVEVPMVQRDLVPGRPGAVEVHLRRVAEIPHVEVREPEERESSPGEKAQEAYRSGASAESESGESGGASPREVVGRALQEELDTLSERVDAGSVWLPDELEVAPTQTDWLELERSENRPARIDPGHEAVQYAESSVRESGEVDPVALAVLVSCLYTAVGERVGGQTEVDDFTFHTCHAGRVAGLLGLTADSGGP